MLHFSGQKFIKNAKNRPFWGVFENLKFTVKTVLPDRSISIGQKLAKNAKIQNFKCDILGNFQTMCSLDFGDYVDCIRSFVRITQRVAFLGRWYVRVRERKSRYADNNDDDAETERKTIEMTMEDIKTTPTRVQQKNTATVLPQTKTIILEWSHSVFAGLDCSLTPYWGKRLTTKDKWRWKKKMYLTFWIQYWITWYTSFLYTLRQKSVENTNSRAQIHY